MNHNQRAHVRRATMKREAAGAAMRELEHVQAQLLRAVIESRGWIGPEIPETGTVSVSIPAGLYRRACVAAARAGL